MRNYQRSAGITGWFPPECWLCLTAGWNVAKIAIVTKSAVSPRSWITRKLLQSIRSVWPNNDRFALSRLGAMPRNCRPAHSSHCRQALQLDLSSMMQQTPPGCNCFQHWTASSMLECLHENLVCSPSNSVASAVPWTCCRCEIDDCLGAYWTWQLWFYLGGSRILQGFDCLTHLFLVNTSLILYCCQFSSSGRKGGLCSYSIAWPCRTYSSLETPCWRDRAMTGGSMPLGAW